MKKIWITSGLLFLLACNKQLNEPEKVTIPDEEITARGGKPQGSVFTTYTIQAGQHYCDQNSVKKVRTSEMNFVVKFDNSAIYQTVLPENQYDINKLWGFTEGINNQKNSARIGWSWNNDALRLYGYVYANGIRYYQEITTVSPDTEISCSIKPSGNTYIFTVNNSSVTLPRGPSTSQANGYQQYPYFGGDETAPHLITILIKS